MLPVVYTQEDFEDFYSPLSQWILLICIKSSVPPLFPMVVCPKIGLPDLMGSAPPGLSVLCFILYSCQIQACFGPKLISQYPRLAGSGPFSGPDRWAIELEVLEPCPWRCGASSNVVVEKGLKAASRRQPCRTGAKCW